MALATFLRVSRQNCTWQLLIRRHCSQLPVQGSPKGTVASEQPPEETPPRIPMVPKRRDPNAVLKALASTVERVEHESFRGMGMADPLHPVKKSVKMDYVRHYEAGRKAAKYVMYKWPKLFRFKKLDSDPVLWEKIPLERNIRKRRPYKALWIYYKMLENNEEVSLDTKNALLALVAYQGLGSRWAHPEGAAEVLKSQEDLSWWPPGQEEGEGATRSSGESEGVGTGVELCEKKINGGVKIWTLDNAAEKLFHEITDKNSDTYEALIQGLVKHKNYKRAFEVFEDMRSEGFQASVQTYNLLLSSLIDCFRLSVDNKPLANRAWNLGTHLLTRISEEPIAWPDTATFNHMLRLASVNFSAVELSGRVMREMFHVGVKPSLTTFYWLVRTYAVRGPVFVLDEIVDYLENNPQTVAIQDVQCYVFFEEAMTACLRMRDGSIATRLLALVENSGNYGIVSNLNFFVGAYLRILTNNVRNPNILISEYNRLIPLRIVPFEWLYRIFFDFCSRTGSTDFAVQLWQDMQKYSVAIEEVATVNRFCNVIGHAVIVAEQAEKFAEMVERGVEQLKYRGVKPSSVIVNTLIRLASLSKNTDKMWEYYSLFEKSDIEPTYVSLFQMLKAHHGSPDTESVIWIMREMVKRGMSLDLHYLRDVCEQSNISKDICNELEEQFEANKERRRPIVEDLDSLSESVD